MALESIYLLSSTAFVLLIGLHIANILYFRHKGVTLLGTKPPAGSHEHKNLLIALKARNIWLALGALIISVANLAFDVYRLWNLGNDIYARGALLVIPLFTVVLFTIITLTFHHEYGDKSSGHDNDK